MEQSLKRTVSAAAQRARCAHAANDSDRLITKQTHTWTQIAKIMAATFTMLRDRQQPSASAGPGARGPLDCAALIACATTHGWPLSKALDGLQRTRPSGLRNDLTRKHISELLPPVLPDGRSGLPVLCPT